MKTSRLKNVNWNLPVEPNGNPATWNIVEVALLMDIRDELQRLNDVFHCENFLAIPRKLDDIRRNTAKKRKASKRKSTKS